MDVNAVVSFLLRDLAAVQPSRQKGFGYKGAAAAVFGLDEPVTALWSGGALSQRVPGIGPSTIEFATDSTRTITHILFSGVATKYPDIRWIFSHSGGTVPFLTARLELVAQQRKMACGAAPILRKFYYELAQGNTPGQLAALLKMVPISQVLYGTDYPFRDGAEVNGGIAAYGFTADDLRSIEREVALRLIPRLKQA